MEDFLLMFKSNPLAAVGMVIFGGVGYWVKNRSEKATDSKEVTRLQAAIEATVKDRDTTVSRITTERDAMREERDEAQARADGAFQKQLELTERFSDMRAQLAQALAKLEQVSTQLASQASDAQTLRDKVTELTGQNRELSAQVSRLQTTIDSGAK